MAEPVRTNKKPARWRPRLLCPLAIALVVCAGRLEADNIDPSISAILQNRCSECHSSTTRESGLSVETLEDLLIGGASGRPAITPGHPERSVLIAHVTGEIAPRMPHKQEPLEPAQIAALSKWIRELKLERHADSGVWWSYRKIKPVTPPRVTHATAANPIDAFIAARLTETGLSPAPPATKRELLRRAYFTLIGVPPTPAQAKAFLDDERPDAWARLIDRLLDDPRYGERWARHWLDLARYADTEGFETDAEMPYAWRYRDYVIKAFNTDKPYDRFVREQLAGDEISPFDPDCQIATGFYRVAPQYQTTIATEQRQQLLNEVTTTVGQVFLAQTLGCAQCHDHKYDPIPQRDFYRLQAFFVPVEFTTLDIPYVHADIKARTQAVIAEAQAKLDAAKSELNALQEAFFQRIADASADKKKPNVLQLRVRFALIDESKDTLFTPDERKRYFDLIKLVESSGEALFRLPGLYDRIIRRHQPKAMTVRNVHQVGDRPVFNFAFVRVRGQYDQLGDRVYPGFLVAVEGEEKPAELITDRFGNLGKMRSVMADWIVSPDNPLAARVMVNRIWQHHFGRGLVATPSDFGRQGAKPTHPELLDFLAQRFIDSGWSVKAMHRLIMASATFRQTSHVDDHAARSTDPANRLLWKFDRRRLEGEAIRDAILAVSGMMNRTMFGPGVFPPMPEGVITVNEGSDVWEPMPGPESWRRSIYVMQRRQLELPLLTVLDAPVPSQHRPLRPVSTTPLQALALFNGTLVDEAAEHFAHRIRAHVGTDDPGAQVNAAWWMALARTPDTDEMELATTQLSRDPQYGLVDLCRVLLNMNEFVYVD